MVLLVLKTEKKIKNKLRPPTNIAPLFIPDNIKNIQIKNPAYWTNGFLFQKQNKGNKAENK